MCEGFFSAARGLHPKDERRSGEGISIPDGWSTDWWLGRPVWEGMLTWPQLEEIDLKSLMEMHRSMNLKSYLEAKFYEKVRGESK